MTIRILLAMLVATALLGAAVPVIDEARQDAAASEVEREARTLSDAIENLARSGDPVPRGVPGGRRIVPVTLPKESAEAVIVVGSGSASPAVDTDRADVVSYRTGPSRSGRIQVEADVRVEQEDGVGPDSAGLAIRDSQSLVLRYELLDDRPVVTVSRNGVT